MSFHFEKGEILLINKPYEWTSFDVVNYIRVQLKEKQGLQKVKTGHAGTLDPLATGLLIVCTGKATKRIAEIQNEEKEYTGTFTLGATTPCDDMEKPVDNVFPYDHITKRMIQDVTKRFTGKIQQVPPVFSAIKISGKRAYKLARMSEEMKMQPRMVEIKLFEITAIRLPEVDFRVVCSKGTYIRSLARDFGLALNSGAYLSALCRQRIGKYKLEDAVTPEIFANIIGFL